MRNKVVKAYAMTDVKPIFVSLVDKAANQRQFLLTKSAGWQRNLSDLWKNPESRQ